MFWDLNLPLITAEDLLDIGDNLGESLHVLCAGSSLAWSPTISWTGGPADRLLHRSFPAPSSGQGQPRLVESKGTAPISRRYTRTGSSV
jgi:hypothetical protein